jgi:hypothetical protein
MNAHLWAPNSGRMLWMTQPAWPSTMWQIFSHDYDTQASYYGVKIACEPVHVQLDLSNYEVAVVNTTTSPLPGVSLDASVYSLDNKLLLHHQEQKDAGANAVTSGFKLDLASSMSTHVVLVKLVLRDASGRLVSQNLYWLAAASPSYRELGRLPAAQVSASAGSARAGDTIRVHVRLQNNSAAVALQNKLTLLNAADASRILPAYFSDNYVSLLPGEAREIEIEYPASAAKGPPEIAIRGWNLSSQMIHVGEGK